MDDAYERIEVQDPVRSLFIEAGHIAPSAGLEERVVRAIGTPADVTRKVPSLISIQAWLILVFLLLTVLMIGSMHSPEGAFTPTGPVTSTFGESVGEFAEWLRSGWVLAAMACLGALVLIDHAIILRRRSPLVV